MRITVQNVIDALTNPPILMNSTVDHLLFGDPTARVTGVAVTFLATQEVIEKSKASGLNMIVSHEGIFYSHWGKTDGLKNDEIYLQKLHTIQDYGISVFRYHDYIHRFMPDGITSGLLQCLGWKKYEVENLPAASIVEIPPTTLDEVIKHVKERLGIKYLRFMGDLSSRCSRVGILVGYRGGGELVVPLFTEKNLDMVIYGEGPEWETPEYIRDAVYQKRQKSLLVLGHAESEMPGMKYLADSLQNKFPEIPVHFIPQGPVFQIG
ncbi:Nif3-like dinuclear metal center hexameric protein [Clostridium thermarum]|uniref:Nif3-like dinuclear metal center hexameric protein n=1 Tax=Clostridium thermarum TaxID=1716543 RepID=UPI0013D1D797|nr:Nif3-like dinuclear metal center hexameric protein [Clostridium thermarum]